MKLKEWLSGLFKYIFKSWLMNYPSFKFRRFFLKRVLNTLGDRTFIAMGIDIMGKDGRISIGRNCVINKNVILDARGGDLIIGDNVDIGQETNIWTTEHDPNDANHGTRGAAVIIEDHVWIATRVTILPGVKIGRGAVVACNSVVTRNVNEKEIVGGVPAKVIGLRSNELTYNINYRPWFL